LSQTDGEAWKRAAEELLTLDIQEDFAEKLATGRPAQALTELIWNGLDAEARNVKITSQAGPLALESIGCPMTATA
jgi:hypothetical protein